MRWLHFIAAAIGWALVALFLARTAGLIDAYIYIGPPKPPLGSAARPLV